MTEYKISIFFDDTTDELIVPLTGVDHETAESFTAELRSDLEHAKTLGAPRLETELPDQPNSQLTIDPRRVRSVDLQSAD